MVLIERESLRSSQSSLSGKGLGDRQAVTGTLDNNRENEVSIFSMLHLKGSNTVLVAVVSR